MATDQKEERPRSFIFIGVRELRENQRARDSIEPDEHQDGEIVQLARNMV
jgi:hypothetical protein